MADAPEMRDTPAVRAELPPLPSRIRRLPVDHRGYPVPFFVAWVEGKPDFRIIDPVKLARCVHEHRCWICGDRLGVYLAFVIGPMCAVNRISSEPPSHRECAEFAAIACPFLARPHMRRREGGLPEELAPERGFAIRRNPGVALVWVTKTFQMIRDPNSGGPLFVVGDPRSVACYAHGRRATPEEIAASVDSGLPTLVEAAQADGPRAIAALERQVGRARQLLGIPAAEDAHVH